MESARNPTGFRRWDEWRLGVIRSDSHPRLVETISTDIISFLNDYGELKGYTTKILYNNKEIGPKSMFEQFNPVFRYIDNVTEPSTNS